MGFSFPIRIRSIRGHCYIWLVSTDGVLGDVELVLSSVNILFFLVGICYTRGFFQHIKNEHTT